MSHRLSSVTIVNYRSIRSHTFNLSEYTPLIGYNNAGKTNIIRAIKWLLRKTSLGSDCFYDPLQAVEVFGIIEGITEELLSALPANHRTTLRPFIANEKIQIKRVQNRPGEGMASIKLLVKNPLIEDDEDSWRPNPNGIDAALTGLFPDPIHIGAMENAEEDVSKSKSTSTIGKLLAEIINPIEEIYGDRVRTALSSFQSLLDADGRDRASELDRFDETMNSKIDDFFPDVKVKLHIPTPELKEVFSKGTIKVYEENGASGRDVASFGHGAQRSIQMALIRHLAELKRSEEDVNTCTMLLIDEPELYLHPQAIEVVKDALKQLSKDGYQIIFSTHSAMMLTHEDVCNAIIVRKSIEEGTYKRDTVRSAIYHLMHDAPSQLQLLFSFGNASSILFSERVILTEGTTEERVLPHVIKKLKGKPLGLLKCALIRQGGSGSTRKSMLVLHAMNIPCKAIVDLDYACRNSVQDGYLAEDDVDLIGCKTVLTSLAREHDFRCDSSGWPCKGGAINASDAFALLAEHEDGAQFIGNLHSKLKAYNIWTWTKGTIEDHLPIAGKSEQHWADFVTSFEVLPPETVIANHPDVIDCIGWLMA